MRPAQPTTCPTALTSSALCHAEQPSRPSTISPTGAMLILGGPPTAGGAHHACVISPEGDFLLEHVSAGVCQTYFPVSSLTPAALETVLHLLETPPYCCSKKRLHSTHRGTIGLGTLPRRPPADATPHVPLLGVNFFPPFPVVLPRDAYRAPPLSAVLEATPASEKMLFLQPDAKPLVRSFLNSLNNKENVWLIAHS